MKFQVCSPSTPLMLPSRRSRSPWMSIFPRWPPRPILISRLRSPRTCFQPRYSSLTPMRHSLGVMGCLTADVGSGEFRSLGLLSLEAWKFFKLNLVVLSTVHCADPYGLIILHFFLFVSLGFFFLLVKCFFANIKKGMSVREFSNSSGRVKSKFDVYKSLNILLHWTYRILGKIMKFPQTCHFCYSLRRSFKCSSNFMVGS